MILKREIIGMLKLIGIVLGAMFILFGLPLFGYMLLIWFAAKCFGKL